MPRLSARSAVLAPLLPGLSVLALALGACKPPEAEAGEDTAASGVKEREVPPIHAFTVERREMVYLLETTSKLESEREIQLYPEVPGIAVEILAEEGDTVETGEVLARLDDRDERLSVRDSEVALKEAEDRLVLAELAVEEATADIASKAKAARQAERDYERDKRLSESTEVASPLSQQALEARLLERENALYAEQQSKLMLRRKKLEREQARTAIARAEVALELANRALAKKELVAPFDGVIAQRTIRVGDNVGTAESAFVLTDVQNLRAVFARPQEELGLFGRLGTANGSGSNLTIEATAEAYPGVLFEGWVERISPTIEADSGQFRVTARLRHVGATIENGDTSAQLLPGMLVRMNIVTDRHADALVVPKRALRREGDRRYVLCVETEDDSDELSVRRVDVDEGFEDEEFVELLPLETGGLDAGDVIVLVGSRDLVDGDPVRIEDGREEAGTEESGDEAAVTEPADDGPTDGSDA